MKRKITFPLAVLLLLNSFVFAQTTISWTAADQGYENGVVIESIDFDTHVTGAFYAGTNNNAPKYYTSGSAIRCYGGNYFTITSDDDNLTSITMTFASGEGSNAITTNVGTYSNGTWTGDAESVTFTIGGSTGHRRIASFNITYGGEAPTTYTVTYDCNGGTSGCPENVTGVAAGTSINLAGAPEKTDYTFDGWNDGTTTYEAGASYTVNGNVTFTAQWTENTTPGGDEQWVLTNLADLTTNDVFVIVGNNGSNYAMKNSGASSSGPVVVAVTVNGNNLVGTIGDDIKWNISGNATDGYVFYPDGSTTTWLYCTNNNNGLRIGNGNTDYNTFEIKESYIYNKGRVRYVGIYNSTDWRSYTSINNNIANQTFAFYKKVTGGIVPPSISAENVDIAYNATSGSIDYTINNEPDPVGTLTAAIKDGTTPTIADFSLGTVTSEVVPFTCSANNTGTARTATVTLTYTYNREAVTKDVTVTQAGNPNAVMTIAEVRALGTGTTVATKGVVTSISVSGNNKTAYMQDNTAGIVAFGPFTTEVAVGDEIRVEGELTEYHGLLEIGKNTAAPTVTVLSQNNTVTPVVKTIAEISNNIQAQLVKVENATVTAIDGQNTTIAQGENTIVVRGISGVEYAVNDVLTLTANVGCYDNPQLANPTNVEVQHAPSITFDPAVVDLEAEMQTIQIPFTYDNIVVTNYESFAVHHYDAEGEEIQNTPETPWYIPGVTGTNDDGYNLTVFVSANEGAARSAYMKVSALDAGGTTVYSNLVTVNQAAYVAPFAPVLYTRATEIVSGQHYIIVGFDNENHDNAYAMGEQKNNNRAAVLISEDGTTATVTTADVHEVVITALEGDDNGYYTIEDGGYLYAASSSSNYLRTKSELDDNGKWKIAMENGEFSIAADKSDNRNVMQFNYASKLFSCYASASQKPVYLYVKSDEAPSSYTLNVTGYGENEGGYVLIASPINNLNPATIEGMTTGDFDLYYFDQAEEDEWINYEAGAFNLVPGKGYLYAHDTDVALTFTGTPYNGNGVFPLSYTEGASLAGWNLMGNPYTYDVTVDKDFYIMNEDGDEIITPEETMPIQPMQGFFVVATAADQTVTFSEYETPTVPLDKLVMNLSRNRGTVIDRAIVRFGEGEQLPKFQLNQNSTKLYIPQGNKDYAIVRSAAQGEMPVSFRASENGTYTLAVEAENVEMNYLHLIDNMTGMDVDLLQTPNYTFEAKTSDYASRFRLVFSANGTTDNEVETFAYFNGSNWTVNNMGEATLQVVDVTGRTVSCETINGNATISLNQTPGVYMFRLVSGNGVKVQKVVVK